MKRNNFHFLKYDERFNPFSKLSKNFLLYFLVDSKADITSPAELLEGDKNISSSIIERKRSYLTLLDINSSYSVFCIVIVDISK